MRKISADFIFPISSEPIPNGILVISDDGTILDLLPEPENQDGIEKYEGIICPGFVNAHCHLELSYLKGKVPEKTGLPSFIKNLNEVRWKASEEEVLPAIQCADAEMKSKGIVGVGDICNGDSTFQTKAKSSIKYHSFIELFGFDKTKAEENFSKGLVLEEKVSQLELSASISPHAPYSLSQQLLQKIGKHSRYSNGLLSMHNQESESENEMFLNGSGEMVDLFENYFKLDMSSWEKSGSSSTATSVSHLPNSNKLLLVHNTYSTQTDIDWANHYNANVFWCLCPNANLYIENTLPNISIFAKMENRVCIGTDSLASNYQLCILEELKTITNHFPEIELGVLLQWATLNGAKFFGWENELGSFEKGKRPGVNLITNYNTQSTTLAENSLIKKIV